MAGKLGVTATGPKTREAGFRVSRLQTLGVSDLIAGVCVAEGSRSDARDARIGGRFLHMFTCCWLREKASPRKRSKVREVGAVSWLGFRYVMRPPNLIYCLSSPPGTSMIVAISCLCFRF